MTNQPQDQAGEGGNALRLASAMTSIAATACERLLALNMRTLERVLSQAARLYPQAASGLLSRQSGGLAAAAPAPLGEPALLIEPALAYSAGLLEICHATVRASADLVSAQAQGQQHRFEALGEQATSQLGQAAQEAADAVGSVVSAGMAAATRVGDVTAEAARNVGLPAGSNGNEPGPLPARPAPRGRSAGSASSRRH